MCDLASYDGIVLQFCWSIRGKPKISNSLELPNSTSTLSRPNSSASIIGFGKTYKKNTHRIVFQQTEFDQEQY